MHVQPVDPACLDAFLSYCRHFRGDHDESFLSEQDLAEFAPGAGEPAFVLLDGDGAVQGAAALMLRGVPPGGAARFRILHARSQEPEHYRLLLTAVLPACRGLGLLTLFLPEERAEPRRAFEALGFTIQRYSWVMRRPPAPLKLLDWPPGLHTRPFRGEIDAADWCRVRNDAFQVLKGYSPLTPQEAMHFLKEPGYFPEGMLLLLDGEQAVGTVLVEQEEDLQPGEPVACVYSLAILQAYQGRGLGRRLLRAAVQAGQTRGLAAACLVVNAENERAASLYLDEGFQKVETWLCYQYEVKLA